MSHPYRSGSTPRRKPPPDLDFSYDNDSFTSSQNNSFHEIPVPRPSSTSEAPSPLDRTRQRLHVNTSMGSPINGSGYTEGGYNDTQYNSFISNNSDFDHNDSAMSDSSYVTMSPKPMGPKELNDYPSLPTSREALRRRSFQQLSRTHPTSLSQNQDGSSQQGFQSLQNFQSSGLQQPPQNYLPPLSKHHSMGELPPRPHVLSRMTEPPRHSGLAEHITYGDSPLNQSPNELTNNQDQSYYSQPQLKRHSHHKSSDLPAPPYPVDFGDLDDPDSPTRYDDSDQESPNFNAVKEYSFFKPEVVLNINSPTPPASASPSPFPSNARTQQIINDAFTTPTKILPLKVNLDGSPTRPDQLYFSGSVSPPRRNSMSPTRNESSSTPSRKSPRRGNSPNRNNSTTPRHYSPNRGGSNINYGNSSSPLFGRSPSLSYDFPIADRSYVDDLDDEIEEASSSDYSETGEYRMSSSDLRNSVYPNDDFVDYVDDDEVVVPTNYFSGLPSLPSPDAYPTRNNTVFSTLTKKSSVYSTATTNSTITISRQRKESELPPIPLVLPQLPFSAKSLNNQHFGTISEPIWSLSNIFSWCGKLQFWLQYQFIPLDEFKVALNNLLKFHKPDLSSELIIRNVDSIIQSMLNSNGLSLTYRPSESVPEGKEYGIMMNGQATVTGVMPELTPCYYTGQHEKGQDLSVKCYSRFCSWNQVIEREEQLQNLNNNEIFLADNWIAYWKIADWESLDKHLVKQQSHLFDLLHNEQMFIQRAALFVEVLAPSFFQKARSNPKVKIPTNFESEVINSRADLVEIHKKVLYEPLLDIYKQDGKFVTNFTGIAEIYSRWTRKVESASMRYVATLPVLYDLMNHDFLKQWIEQVRDDKRVKKLKANGQIIFEHTFNSRYFQLPLELEKISELTDKKHQSALSKAIADVKELSQMVNQKKGSADNLHEIRKLSSIKWGNYNKDRINLKSNNRKLIRRGHLTRRGDLKINSYNNHVILLDNYFIITERSKNKNVVEYTVDKNPIPVELLLVEEREASSKTLGPSGSHSPTSNGPNATSDDDPSSFPFKIRYAGRGKRFAFTFTTKTESERAEWISDFALARTELCKRLHRTEPYSLSLVSNTCFAYEQIDRITKLPICAEQDPVYDLSVDASKKLKLGPKNDIYSLAGSVVFSKVLSMCSFEFMGSRFILIGLASGLYCSDLKTKWKKVANGSDFVKITSDTSINLLLVLSGAKLNYYSLDSIVEVYYERKKNLTSVQLSHKTLFFEIGRHKAMTMLFVAKSNSSGTDFTVLIPETDNGGVFSSFKEYKKFHVAATCYGVSIFNSTFAVHTNRGLEILNLTTLIPRSIPDFSNSGAPSRRSSTSSSASNSNNVEAIKAAVHSTSIRPMGMFKIVKGSETEGHEFLLVYSNFAIFVDASGRLSRNTILRFEFQAKSIAFVKNSLFLICDEVIEIWRISEFANGSNGLIQVITGKGIHMINSDQLAFSMANPKVLGLQLVFELRKRV
ncbi:CNH domain-containing protein [Scheffersomyces xylosifermentans]|uniref:CNH domain-containing protein n=1 Tax=Scheffersomyces xylosifermentans TaxID=1304137 RepID=UPI00315CF864